MYLFLLYEFWASLTSALVLNHIESELTDLNVINAIKSNQPEEMKQVLIITVIELE